MLCKTLENIVSFILTTLFNKMELLNLGYLVKKDGTFLHQWDLFLLKNQFIKKICLWAKSRKILNVCYSGAAVFQKYLLFWLFKKNIGNLRIVFSISFRVNFKFELLYLCRTFTYVGWWNIHSHYTTSNYYLEKWHKYISA